MLFTLAMVVFMGGIFICFSQEFIRVFKKILEVKGAKLILPLMLGSLLVAQFDLIILWGLYYYREVLTSVVLFVNHPFATSPLAYPIILIILLTLISVIPVLLLELFWWKRSYKHYPLPNLTSIILWIVSSFVMIVR